MDKKIKHLEFVQSIITRMNTNSFQIKGMTITIVSALLAVFASTLKTPFIFIGIAPTILFWFLDTYYLQQERKFRGVYNNVGGIKNDVTIVDFEMPIHKFIGGQYSYFKVFWSKTIAWLYASVIVFLLILGLVIIFKDCLLK